MEDKTVVNNHRVHIANRENAGITGVSDVISFDITGVVLETQMGIMNIKGNNLHVKRLSLDKGEIDLDGQIDAILYSDLKKYRKSKESLMGRLFK